MTNQVGAIAGQSPASVQQQYPPGDAAWFRALGADLMPAVSTEITVLRRSLAAFVAFQLYVLATAISVTHVDLLLNHPIAMPLVGLQLPQSSVLTMLPLLVLACQIVLLLRLVALVPRLDLLAEIASAYELYYEPAGRRFRAQLPAFSLVQIKTGAGHRSVSLYARQMALAIPLVMLPMLVMVAVQIRCLPLHSDGLTWFHRVLVLAQVPLVIVMLRLCTPARSRQKESKRRLFAARLPSVTLWTSAALSLTLSLLVATLPDEPIDKILRSTVSVGVPGQSGETPPGPRVAFAPTAVLFDGSLDPRTGLPNSLFSRNLIVTDRVIMLAGQSRLSLRGRDLRYSRLDRTTLQGVDLSGADLTGASLIETNLSGSFLSMANFSNSQLIATDLSNATVAQTRFGFATMILVKFENAKMQCDRSHLCGLTSARLQNVSGLAPDLAEAIRQAIPSQASPR
jgi:hypothetical protein